MGTPCLVPFNDKLYLAYIQSNDSCLWFLSVYDTQQTWGIQNKITADVSTVSKSGTFSLASVNGHLLLAYVNRSARFCIQVMKPNEEWTTTTDHTDSLQLDPSFTIKQIRVFRINNEKLCCVLGCENGSVFTSTISVDAILNITVQSANNQEISSKTAPCVTYYKDKTWLSYTSNNNSQNVMILPVIEGQASQGRSLRDNAANGDTAIVGINYTSGTVTPKFMVLTLLYAPPGSKGGTASTVVYAESSSAGTEHSVTKLFTAGVSAGITAGISDSDHAGANWSASVSASGTNSVKITKTSSTVFTQPGSKVTDGIDHGLDTFVLWVNPQITVTIDSLGNFNWVPTPFTDPQTGTALIVTGNMSVSTLKDCISLYEQITAGTGNNADLRNQLSIINPHNLTQLECESLLALNPLLSTDAPDPLRYIPAEPAGIGYSYDNGSGTVQAGSASISVQSQQQASISASAHYSVSATAQEDFLTETIGASLGLKNSASLSATNISTQSAQYTINPPSASYNQSETLYIYWDKIYKTFAFSFTPPPQQSA
jgi:hypothetical protein